MRKVFVYLLVPLSVLFAGCGSSSPDDYELWGIDISRHQKKVDWQEVYDKNPPHFVFLKATEGLLIADPAYDRHTRELDEMGVLWGAYHFFGHRTGGRQQARNFIRTAKLKSGNLIPVLDIEPHRFMTDPGKSVREAKAFCREIRGYYGVNPIIYSSANFYETFLKKEFSPKEYTLWIADYRGDPRHLKWRIWQHTDCHRLEGISGGVDRNVFNGKQEHLKRLTL